MNKRAIIFGLLTALLVVLVILPMAFFRLDAKKNAFEKSLGDMQINLLQAYLQGEKDLFYIDQSAKYAAYNSIFELAENGGFTKLGSKCGRYLDYNLWKGQQECFPDYKNNFKSYFSSNIGAYLSGGGIGPANYDIFLDKDQIIGTTKDKLFYKIENGNYSVNPSFSLRTGYDLEIYLEMRYVAEELLKRCKGDVNVSDCVALYKKDSWIIGSCEGDMTNDGKNFRFCVKGNSYPYFTSSSVSEKQIFYRFALYFG